MLHYLLQESQMLQRDHTMLCVIEYFAKALKVTGKCIARSIVHKFLLAFCTVLTIALSRIISEIKRDCGQNCNFYPTIQCTVQTMLL